MGKQMITVYLKLPQKVTGAHPDPGIMAMANKLAQEHGGQRKWTMSFDNRIFLAEVDSEAIAKLQENPLVDKVVIEAVSRHLLTGPFPAYNPLAVNTDWGVNRIHPEYAWNNGFFGQGVKVGILDTGIRKEHEAFWKDGVPVFKGGYDFINHDRDSHDDHGHGTWCAGILAAQHNGIPGSYRGVAPGIELYVVKTQAADGSGTAGSMAAGIDWCWQHGIQIINISVGGIVPNEVEQQACDHAYANGCLLVAAAGNDGNAPGYDVVVYPARYDSVIAVAAVDIAELVASFSAWGAAVELAAPGVAVVGPSWPDSAVNSFVAGSNQKYAVDEGTSAACPHVAAAAALIKNHYPAATNVELRQMLIDHARDL
jgi:subtilisin family serine protease